MPQTQVKKSSKRRKESQPKRRRYNASERNKKNNIKRLIKHAKKYDQEGNDITAINKYKKLTLGREYPKFEKKRRKNVRKNQDKPNTVQSL